MAIGLLVLIVGALVDDLVGLSSFWHGMGWGIGIVVALMFVGDMIKHGDEYFD